MSVSSDHSQALVYTQPAVAPIESFAKDFTEIAGLAQLWLTRAPQICRQRMQV